MNDIELIRSSIDLREVWPWYVGNEKRTSDCVITRCPQPDHNDSTPSCAVYRDGAFCFGCGKRIDVFDAYMMVHGCDFKDAVKALSNGHKWDTVKVVKRVVVKSQEWKSPMQLEELEQFKPLSKMLDGLLPETAKEFDLREWGNRIIVPVWRHGNLENIKVYRPGGTPKWMPLTEGRGKQLYGADRANGRVFIVESEKDVWYAWQIGVCAVATGGASVFNREMRRDLDNVKEVFVLGDMDKAGRDFNVRVQSKMRRAIPVWWRHLGSFMQEGYDLADFVKDKGTADLLDEIVEKSKRDGGYFYDELVDADDL